MAGAQAAHGKHAEALPVLREVVQGFSRLLGPRDETTLHHKHTCGRCLMQCGLLAESVDMLQEVHAALVALRGSGHVETLRVQADLGNSLGCSIQGGVRE